MSFDERIWFLILGCFIGFILGYLTRLLRETRSSIQEVQKSVHDSAEAAVMHDDASVIRDEATLARDKAHDRHDAGFVMPDLSFNNIMMIVVVVATLYASVISQITANTVRDAQQQDTQNVACNHHFLSKTIHALNQRTRVAAENTKANVNLVDSETRFFGILLHVPAYGVDVQLQASKDYFSDLTKFLKVSKRLEENHRHNPFPTLDDLQRCSQGKTHIGSKEL